MINIYLVNIHHHTFTHFFPSAENFWFTFLTFKYTIVSYRNTIIKYHIENSSFLNIVITAVLKSLLHLTSGDSLYWLFLPWSQFPLSLHISSFFVELLDILDDVTNVAFFFFFPKCGFWLPLFFGLSFPTLLARVLQFLFLFLRLVSSRSPPDQ